jgi:hypothetical protein
VTLEGQVYVHLGGYLCVNRIRGAGVDVFLFALHGKTTHGTDGSGPVVTVQGAPRVWSLLYNGKI